MTKIVGHRGARKLWPENSLDGFRKAIALGVDAVEFDVHLTRAGELLVHHDALLDRCTDATGPIRDLTPEARAKVRLKEDGGSLPTLREALEILAPAGVELHIEIKRDEEGNAYDGIAKMVGDLAAEFGVTARSYLTSFGFDVLEELRDEAPAFERLISVNRDWMERAGGIDAFAARALPLCQIIAIHHEILEENWERITALIPKDRICVWVIDDEAPLRHWFARQTGYLTSDRPDNALRIRAEQKDH